MLFIVRANTKSQPVISVLREAERWSLCSRKLRRIQGKGKEEPMTLSPLAGKPAPKDILVDLARLEREYYTRRPDMEDPTQRVSFGTSGHRGSALHGSFTEAITQAICDYH